MTAPITMAKNIINSLPTDTSYDEIIKELVNYTPVNEYPNCHKINK